MTSLSNMEARDSGDHLSKQLCSNCDTSQSKFWCLDCNGSLCGDCELAHRRVSLTKSHRLRNQPQSVARILVAPVKYCGLHTSEPLELYCFTCDQFTCKDCQLTTHRSHSFEFVSKAMVAVRRQLQACVQPASAKKDTLTKTMQDMECRLEDIQVNRAHLKSNLLNYYFGMVHGLKDKVSKTFQDILEVYRSETEQIDSRLKQLKLLQQKHVAMTETSQQCKNVSDLQTLLNMKKQIESHVKDFLDQDLSPPSNMSRVTVTSSVKMMEVINNSFQVKLSWIPFSVSQSSGQRTNPPPPACPEGNLLPSTTPNYPSLHHLTPRDYPPLSSSSNPSSSSSFFTSSQTSSSTNPVPPCKNPPRSTSTAPLSLPHASSFFIPTSKSSPLMNILRHPMQMGDTHSSSSSASSFHPFTCSPVSSTSATTAPAPQVMSSAEQLRSTSRTAQPSHLTFNVVPRSDLLRKHQTPLSQHTLPPVPRPQQAAPSQNQQPMVPPQPLPTVPPVPPPQQTAPSQNQQPMVLPQLLPTVPPVPLPQQTDLPSAGAPIFCLTNVYTPPTVLIPTHSQSGWFPIHQSPLPTKPPPCYPSQTPIVAFSMGQQFNRVEGAFLGSLGPVPPTHQTLPVTCNLMPLSGSTFLQQTPVNQDSVVLSGPSSHQKHVSESRAGLLRKQVSHRLSKPGEDKPSRTTVLEQTEPAEDEPTSTLPDETDSAENEPTSTTADQPDPPPDEPSTTTSVEEDSKLITSTSEDIEFVETPNANEEQPSPVFGRRRANLDKRQLRLSLVRLPIAPPTPESPLPSFRLVHGEVENEIYLMEITGSPTKAGSELDVTELLNEANSELDFTQPLSSPGSDLSVEILSCSVCVSSDSLLICSACARGFHRECHIPPMGPDITPGWICSLCQDLSDPSDPYSSVRLPDPLERGLNPRDQRSCESLLLFLKVEGCSRLTEFASWVLLEPIADRLRLCLEPPYKTAVDFVSDIWPVFRDASRDDALKNLQKSFRKKVKKVLGREKRLLELLLSGAEEDQPESRPRLSHVKKRLKSILDTKTPKKMKTM